MRLFFKPKVTIIGLVLMAGMLRASYWQWQRHLQKLIYIQTLQEHFQQPPSPILDLLNSNWPDLTHRRVLVKGTYDFAHEFVLRNRMYQNFAGVHAITPLKIEGSEKYILIDRGFLPLDKAKLEQRAKYQKPTEVALVGVVQASLARGLFGPKDPEAGPGRPWVDAWLRVDIENIQKQLPYSVLPIYLEVLANNIDPAKPLDSFINDKSGRDDIMSLSGGTKVQQMDSSSLGENLPIPVVDTIVSAGRHLGYVYEWAFMAFMTFLICLVLQLRPSARPTSS